MLKLDNVTKVFGNSTTVDRASFEVSSPMMIGVIGASGAGKSTLLRMLNRLEDVTDGSIIYEGQEISQLSGKDMRLWQSNCAMIFQQFNLVPRMDVVSNVLHGTLNRHSAFSTFFNFFKKHLFQECIGQKQWCEVLKTRTKPYVASLSTGVCIMHALDPEVVRRPRLLCVGTAT